ncbi:hypothetical protein M2159_008831 [Streptomyces sp. SAI-090]|nr:hypothetical protein [Streptomyces sp. SAI-090]
MHNHPPGSAPSTSHGPFGRVVRVPIPDQRPHYEHAPWTGAFPERLADFLAGLIPLFIAELASATDEQINQARDAALEQIANHGDDLQFGGKHRRSSRTALARAFALLARAEGGVTALGVHACTAVHEGCPSLKPPASASPSSDTDS